jgi:succinate dehydrogenase flavin-adding protein (antitoxin of CptAB toxin-antitoxin module)
MRELDVLLTNYLEQRYKHAPVVEQQTFQALLELSDNQLQNYLLGEGKPEDRRMLDLVLKIIQNNYKDVI